MAALRGAAEVEEVGVMHDQRPVQALVLQALLQGMYAGVDLTFWRIEHDIFQCLVNESSSYLSSVAWQNHLGSDLPACLYSV
jgi:hypothetical protein